MSRQMTDLAVPKKPKPGIQHTDWDALEREFILNDEEPLARTWLRKVQGWSEEKINAGNTQERLQGWGRKRADFQQIVTRDAIEATRQAESERYPTLLKAKMNLVAKMVEDVTKGSRWDVMSMRDRRHVYEILKTELGEPSRISKSDISLTADPTAEVLNKLEDDYEAMGRAAGEQVVALDPSVQDQE